MKYAGLKLNDCVDGEGITVSFWTQGCPHRCSGCHNPETWDFEGGLELPSDIRSQIIKAISANGIQRDFAVLGGEPLCMQNRELVNEIIGSVRAAYPHIKIYLWTGYTYEELLKLNNSVINSILDKIDILIDGPFILEKRNLNLKLCGSENQRVINLKN